MFEKIGVAAEKLATSVSESRRGFLVRTGKLALVAASAVGGLLALPKEAQAFGDLCCCYFKAPRYRQSRCGFGAQCPSVPGWTLVWSRTGIPCWDCGRLCAGVW
jgi:hypothetical protein